MRAEYLARISRHLQELDAIPLFGNAPSFELEKLGALLSKSLHLEDLSIHVKTQKWIKAEEEIDTNDAFLHAISIAPIEAPVYWKISKADQTKLTSLILLHKAKKKAFTANVLQEGFYRFLLLEVLHAAQNISPLQQMTLSLQETRAVKEEDSLLTTVEISCEEHTIWGHLIIPKSFQHDWVQHFSAFPKSPMRRKRKIPIDIGLRIGSVRFSQKEWTKLKPGDFVLPDTLLQEGNALLCLRNFPLFYVQTQENQIHIKEYAFTIEDTMDKSENEPVDSLGERLDLAEQETKAIQDIPLYVHVEFARLKMTLDQLMDLSPGNFLQLPAHAPQAVTLTVNGQKIGTAELVSLGETLGLKILELGS